jgi:DNA-binding MarR family transcriptional regulator
MAVGSENTKRRRQTKAELVDELGMAFRVAQNRSQALDELVAQRLGVNLTDLRCLDIVEQQGRITAGRLAELAGLTTGAVTAVLDRLEQLGYARRVRDTNDRRRVLVELTERAQRATWEIYGPLKAEWDRLLARYTVEELRLFLDMLDRGEEVGRRQVEHLRTLGPKRRPDLPMGQEPPAS